MEIQEVSKACIFNTQLIGFIPKQGFHAFSKVSLERSLVIVTLLLIYNRKPL